MFRKWAVAIAILLLFFLVTSASSFFQESPYKLPYPAGAEYIVRQGNFGSFSHSKQHFKGYGIYAFDFNLKDGDPVVASRAGRVFLVKDDSNIGGCSGNYIRYANYIIIDHGDGTSALYLHLQYNSATVKEGEKVEQGQIIARANSSGYVCGAHLHFQVQETPKSRQNWYTQSIQISFSDKDVLAKEPDGIPKEGKSYISDNVAPGVITPPPEVACPPEGEPKFNLGQEVITTDALKVRETPGPISPENEIKTQPKGTSGKILEGPVCAYDYVWWRVEYEDKIVGWSAQDWLELKEPRFERSYLCDFSKPVPLRETTKYGIFGDDAFDTVVCGYLKLKEEIVWEQPQINAYFVIMDFLHEGFIRSIEEGIRIGNAVNTKEDGFYWFNLGCFKNGEIIGDFGAIMDAETQKALLNSSSERLVSIILSFKERLGRGCGCCCLAEKVSLYPPPPSEETISPEVLTITNPYLDFSLSEFTVYEEELAPRKPEGYIFLVLHQEGVKIKGPEIPATGIEFHLEDEGIYEYGDEFWLAHVNNQLSYYLRLEDNDGEGIALYQVKLTREGNRIKSDFIFVAHRGVYGEAPGAYGGIIWFTISAIGDGVGLLAPPKSFTIEVRESRESDVIVP